MGSRHAAALTCALLLTGCAAPTPAAPSPTTSAPSTTPSAPSAATSRPFDLQAHRGGMGLTTEEQPAAYAKALALGVSTLEMDTQVTADRQVVVNHDRVIDARKCRDTGANSFVGQAIVGLTLAQVRTLDCGYKRFPGFDEQEVVTGAHPATLAEVVEVWRAHGAPDVGFDIEIKFDPAKAAESVGREEFARVVVDEIDRLGIGDRTMIQSFDWLTLTEVHRLRQGWPLVALTSSDEFGPDLAAGVAGVTVYAPKEGILTRAMVEQAHARGLRVVPWTVDDPSRMEVLIALGVDGLITNNPDRARTVMAAAGLELPTPAVGGRL